MSHAKNASPSILGDMKPSKAIVKLALPATLALLAKAVYNIVDTAYIGMLNSDILILPKLFGVAGIYFAQPAADVLTILVCVLSVKSMKRIASERMGQTIA